MLKRFGAYFIVLLVGLVFGYLFFGTKSESGKQKDSSNIGHVHSWTCSMHPQIKSKESGDCPLCGMDLTPVSVNNSEIDSQQFKMTANAMALANIETTVVGFGSLKSNTLVLSGKIESNEKTNSVQTTIFDGRIEKLNVNYVGQYIKKGQLLGSIYSPELYAAQDKLLTSVSYKDTHKKLYAAARNTLGLWKMTDEQVDAIIKSGKPMMNFPVYADVSGTVTEIIAAEGNWYKQGEALYKVSNLYTVWAIFDAYENQLPGLKVGQEITIMSNAFKGEKLKSKISFIEPVLNSDSRTIVVRVTLNNKKQHFKPGMFVQGEIEGVLGKEVLTVPKSAVLWTGKRSIVYVKPNPNVPVFEMAQITLGEMIGDSYVVLEGVTSGDEVVTNGAFTIDAAAQLLGKKSMMTSKRSGDNLQVDSELTFNDNLKSEFPKIISAYMELKDFLVASNSHKSMLKAGDLKELLNAIDVAVLSKDFRIHINTLKETAEKIAVSKTIKEQRVQFKPLSKSIVILAGNLSHIDQPIYVQYCPMADNNKGGSWLSFDDEVLNPYYGDKMLHCGSVLKTIQ
ncbi:efflux RND transporter periplasmic adaptor subunit [uncultured Maribacter sp.]|uniref:efflux RND transporter periplasmic adaptor subunit n=1 Tax=uncultured Maribacter sp. TaxID=431308 RepID=UPI0026137915|nr:efflux RND transporter periplasmic adaptor subunit [uncultured Maribacter sp.]